MPQVVGRAGGIQEAFAGKSNASGEVGVGNIEAAPRGLQPAILPEPTPVHIPTLSHRY